MTTETQDWRARLMAVLGDRLDDQTKLALAIFAKQARLLVRRLIAKNLSDALLRATAIPVLHGLYARLLGQLDLPYEAPSPKVVEAILDDLIAEIRHGRKVA